MTEEIKQDEYRMQRWVYAGQRIGDWSTGKLTHLWIVMAVDGAGHFQPGEKEYRFDTNITRKVIGARNPAVGSTWDIWLTTTATGISVRTSGENEPQPVTRYDGPQVVEWEAQTRTALAMRDARKAARELASGDSDLVALLAPIKKVYWKESHAGKAALLAAVIAEITGAAQNLPGKPSKAKGKGRI